ncbi:MAG: DUF6263 family protein [Bacteroidia bacterium]
MQKKSVVTIVFFLLLSSAFSLFAQSVSPSKIKLRLNLEKNDHFTISYFAHQDISQVLMETEQNINQTIGMYYTYDVLEADAKSYEIKVTYSRVIFNQDGVTGSTRFDSDSIVETVPPAAKGFAALAGQSFFMTITPMGEVTEVKGIDQMLDNMLVSFEGLDTETRQSLSTSLKNQYGDENTRATMQNLMAIYPRKKVGIGDEWTRVTTINQGFPITMETSYKVKALDQNQATLEVFSKMASNPDVPMEMMGMRLAYQLAGSQQGEILLNPRNGWTIRTSINQDLSGEVNLTSDLLPEGQRWPITMVSEYEIITE